MPSKELAEEDFSKFSSFQSLANQTIWFPNFFHQCKENTGNCAQDCRCFLNASDNFRFVLIF